MGKLKLKVREPVVLYTYADLAMIVEAIPSDEDHVLVLGPPRNGKTAQIERVFWNTRASPHVPSGRVPAPILQGRETASNLYVDLFDYRDERLLIANDLELASDMAILLKQALEKRGRREIRWGIRSPLKEGNRLIPKSFWTATRLVLVGNTLPGDSPDWQAVVGRCSYYHFTPTLEEMLRYVTTWNGMPRAVLGRLERLVGDHPEAISIDLDQVGRAARQHPAGLILSDGTPLWLETLRRSLLDPGSDHLQADLDRLVDRWHARSQSRPQTLAQLCELMGWRADRLRPVLDFAIERCLASRLPPGDTIPGRGRRPGPRYALV
jgi:hypothetical protein